MPIKTNPILPAEACLSSVALAKKEAKAGKPNFKPSEDGVQSTPYGLQDKRYAIYAK